MNATSVIRASTQRPSPSDHMVGFSICIDEATCRFTFVSACSLAVWKLTTMDYSTAASSCYRGVRTIPQTGLQPARLTAVTANGQACINADASCRLLVREPPPQVSVTPRMFCESRFMHTAGLTLMAPRQAAVSLTFLTLPRFIRRSNVFPGTLRRTYWS